MEINELMEKMIVYSNGNKHDIAHFLKVWGYCRTIGQGEHLDEETQKTLEMAAIVHDIACPLCRMKYGNTNGKHQEEESEHLLRDFFQDTDVEKERLERIIYLVSHHHTYTNVDGLDYRILLEGDFLVNADESNYSDEQIQNAKENFYQTETGIKLLESIYQTKEGAR